MSDIKKTLQTIKDHDIKYVDFRFTDPRGKWHHTTQAVRTVDADLLNDGVPFDGSSIAGWKAINESDMLLLPDLATAVLDPFAAQPTLIITCDVADPKSGKNYARDPRSIAKRAEAFIAKAGFADNAYFGPEIEFFVFDDVRFDVAMNQVFYFIDSNEGPYNSGTQMPNGNMGHRPGVKGGYFPVQPVDSGNDLRAEMLTVMGDMGVDIEKHHHEVAASQHELGIKFSTLTKMADAVQIYKYVVHNVAHAYGKTACFMPKPIRGDNGSGMHVHQSLWKKGKPLFAGKSNAGLSEMALYYIGGIIKHARAINAFTNPTTNSYKRLIPGFEAPVLLAYSAHNRSASCRIPYSVGDKAKRVEVRFPDPAANPYLSFAAMLMAGLDGIKNKIHPGKTMDADLYHLPPAELKKVPTVCGSLREALNALDNDRAFLKAGGVFTDDLIDGYLELKWPEVYEMEHTPHPVEFKMYYSV
ncbi:MAG: type I glutamate--ammonia ligase [Dongiaceae bacterium]